MRSIGKDGAVLSEERAREIAEDFAGDRGIRPTAIETERGWYFGWGGEPFLGSKGLVVNKGTGRVFVLGSRPSLDRDLAMYDQGMDVDLHDLVILEITDLDATAELIERLGPTVAEVSYESGTVWRIPRGLTEDEIKARLTNLPAVFPDLRLYFCFEAIVEARAGDSCVIDLLPRTHEPEAFGGYSF